MIDRSFFSILALTLFFVPVQGQTDFSQTHSNGQYNKAKEYFFSKINKNSILINGRLYNKTYPGKKGHQFFGENTWSKSTIIIGDEVFSDVNLRYDVHNNQVVLNYISELGINNISLNKNKIRSFDVSGHQFLNVGFLHADHKFEANQFFEVKANGKAKYLILWTKYLGKTSGAFSGEFIQKGRRYVFCNSKIVEIKNRKHVLSALSDEAEKVHDFIKQNHILIRLATDNDIVSIINYYNSL